jgi:hypothetical protein
VDQPSNAKEPARFVLTRELSEVYLLLDSISADPATTVAERVDGPLRDKQGLGPDWIERICKITWPPDGTESENAADAALLIRAKDYLNRLSHPASGATIAFTHLVTNGPPSDRRRGLLAWLGGKKDGDDAPAPAPVPLSPLSPTMTRWSLAETAYPDLVTKAVAFRRNMFRISAGLLLVLLLTSMLSWYAAWGSATISDYRSARAAFLEAKGAVATLEISREAAAQRAAAGADGASAPSGTAGENPPATQTPPASGTGQTEAAFTALCKRARLQAAEAQACGQAEANDRLLVQAEQRVADWLCWTVFAPCTPKVRNPAGRGEAASRANALVAILAGSVLPFLYGLLGAGAAVVRSLSAQIRANMLNPRDLHLAVLQLALGAVVGATIGLFIASPGSDESGLLSPIGLSAPALAFVAGFGVEGVFQALESLIRRIFNLPETPGSDQGGRRRA